jgi:hypothetical protein
MHERCPLDVMPDGTVLYIAEVGDNTVVPHQGIDLSDEPRTVIIRIQWLFGEHGGCYPPPSLQAGFIQRVESLVRNTPDCHIFVAGNEPNIRTEGLFEPEYAAEMYKSIRVAVLEQSGHENDLVLLPPIGPWNTEIGYGWIEYFTRLIALCPDIDGFALHSYARGPEPENITAQDKMGAPYEEYYSNFQTYRDWMAAIPERYQSRPAYITEFDENDAWENRNTRIIQAVYAEINSWNKTSGNQQIRCLILYRWPHHDKYFIEGNVNVIIDFMFAQDHGYEWEDVPMPEWTGIYETSMDDGFYPYNGEGPLTVPYGSVPLWEHDQDRGQLDRPEYAERTPPHTHNDTPFAAGLFSMHSTMEAAIVWEISVKPGDEVRASVWANGVDGDQAGMGVRLGIATSNPGEGAIAVQSGDGKFTGELESRAQWGDWYGARVDDEWQYVWTGVAIATGSRVWVLMNARKDWANPGHTHWDTMLVESRGGGVIPPPMGTWAVQVVDPVGNVVASCPFEVGSANAAICAHAQAIMGLTCGDDS